MKLLQGDVCAVLATLPAASVHCVVTSPPYWGLRDYAMVGQLGSERTLAEYLANMTAVFRAVWRVLRDDGTLWLNMGDAYTSGGRTWRAPDKKNSGRAMSYRPDTPERLKPKDLIGLPWRLAFALQADGWWLRRDVIWDKPNPLPESATDRPAISHEYIFLLTKAERYFFDMEAVREGVTGNAHARGNGVTPKSRVASRGTRNNDSFSAATKGIVETRNMRSVWRMPIAPFPGAHFATFTPELPERCIKAGTSAVGCCPRCSAPWVRKVIKGKPDLAHQIACGGDREGAYFGQSTKGHDSAGVQNASDVKRRILAGMTDRTSTWAAGCGCDAGATVPALVLDPFGGSGTTGVVADRLGRDCILVELNPEYCAMARRRLEADAGMFAEVEGGREDSDGRTIGVAVGQSARQEAD